MNKNILEKENREKENKDQYNILENIKNMLSDILSRKEKHLIRIPEQLTFKQIENLILSFQTMINEDKSSGLFIPLLNALKKEGYFINKNLLSQIDSATDIESITTTLEKEEHRDTIQALLVYCYNRNFWNTHINDGNNIKDLTLHLPGTIRKERLSEYTPNNFGRFNKIFLNIERTINSIAETFGLGLENIIEQRYKPNIIKMDGKEEQMIKEIILSAERGEKIFIILNHETFANIPLAILKFMQSAKELQIKNINKFFTTIIGPLLNIHKNQIKTINAISNVVITHPADNKIPEAKPIISLQQKGALQQIGLDLSEGGEGQIYFCAPSGTRDIVTYIKNDFGEEIPHIYIPNETRGSNIVTTKMINSLKTKNPDLKIYAISTNTTEMKRGISPTDNTWNKNANITLHINDLNIDQPLEVKDIIKTLESGITYYINRENETKEINCASSISEPVFKRAKKQTKKGKIPKEFLNENGLLNTEKILEINDTSQ